MTNLAIENQDAYDEIINAQPDEDFQDKVWKLIESVPYTSHTFFAIASWLKNMGDTNGSDMIIDFVKNKFAIHEANEV